MIIGGVEANYFTPTQQELLKQFVDRRGGGLLWLGARNGLADGGWERSSVSDLLPVNLPDRKDTFHRDPANVEFTAAGRESLICRLDDDPGRNVERWKKLPYLQNYQESGDAKTRGRRDCRTTPDDQGPPSASRHPKLRAWPDGDFRFVRIVALADVAAVGRQDSRDVLAADASVARGRNERDGGVQCAAFRFR